MFSVKKSRFGISFAMEMMDVAVEATMEQSVKENGDGREATLYIFNHKALEFRCCRSGIV